MLRRVPCYGCAFCASLHDKRIPSSFLSGASREKDTRLQGIFTSILILSLIVFLSQSPVREPIPCSLTRSPQTGILCLQSHWQSEGILFSLRDTQRSTQCTSVAGHSSQRNLTQHGTLPQHPINTTKLISDYF